MENSKYFKGNEIMGKQLAPNLYQQYLEGQIELKKYRRIIQNIMTECLKDNKHNPHSIKRNIVNYSVLKGRACSLVTAQGLIDLQPVIIKFLPYNDAS